MQPITDKREGSLSIGALSQQTGVHIETIRYYERIKRQCQTKFYTACLRAGTR
jgi:hypothetical protein